MSGPAIFAVMIPILIVGVFVTVGVSIATGNGRAPRRRGRWSSGSDAAGSSTTYWADGSAGSSGSGGHHGGHDSSCSSSSCSSSSCSSGSSCGGGGCGGGN